MFPSPVSRSFSLFSQMPISLFLMRSPSPLAPFPQGALPFTAMASWVFRGMTQTIIVVFMILGSLNFTLYFHTLRGKFYRLYEPEFYLYLIVLIGGCLLMSWNLWNTHERSWFPLLLQRFGLWLFSSDFRSDLDRILSFELRSLALHLPAPHSRSHVHRRYVRIDHGRYQNCSLCHHSQSREKKNRIPLSPRTCSDSKNGEREISDKMAITTLTFFCVVVAMVILGSYLLITDHNDPQTALGVISCMINNNSLLLGGTGAFGSFAFLTDFSKIVSIFSMALGRLEYFSLLVLFVPAFWKKS